MDSFMLILQQILAPTHTQRFGSLAIYLNVRNNRDITITNGTLQLHLELCAYDCKVPRQCLCLGI